MTNQDKMKVACQDLVIEVSKLDCNWKRLKYLYDEIGFHLWDLKFDKYEQQLDEHKQQLDELARKAGLGA